MIWLTWRQFRTPAAMTLATLAVLAIVLVITGIPLNHLYYTSGIKTCSSVGDCGQVIGAFFEHDQILQHLRPIVILVPAVVGIFWGAPLVAREIETGTHRMVWTQSITRTRWLATKLGVLGIASIVVTEALNLMETWWFRPIDKINQDRFTGSFSQAGLVPIGYAAFAFALGVTAGLLIRRTLPAMAATLVGFTAARVAMTYWIRPHLLAPAHLNLALDPASTSQWWTDQPVARSAAHSEFLDLLQPHRRQRWPRTYLSTTGEPLPNPRDDRATRRPKRRGTDPWPGTRRHPGKASGMYSEGRHHLPPGSYISTRQPLLDLPVVRNQRLPHRRARAGRTVLLANSAPPHLTNRNPRCA